MIIPDINLLIYAHNAASALHSPSKAWWSGLMQREDPVGLPWAVVFGFVRLVTHPAVLTAPLAPLDAWARVESWMAQTSVQVVEPGTRHLAIVHNLFQQTGVAAQLTTDTHLAAIAIEHQAVLHSNDSDFGRFPGLKWVNPLVARARP